MATKRSFYIAGWQYRQHITEPRRHTYFRGGNGKDRKLKVLDRFKGMESNYIASRRLIDFCVKHQAATLILLDMQENAEIAKEEHFILRNRSYYELMGKIRYKAEKAGIELITT